MNTAKFFFLTIISVILFWGCTGSGETVAYPSMWYIATGTGLVPAFPDYALTEPLSMEKPGEDYAPWTEKISFSDFFVEDNKLYLFTNKAGISVFSPESESPQKEKFTDFYPFPGEISERTCGTLFTVQNSDTGEKPVFFNVYRNTIFSDNQPEANLPGIYRYFPENQTITPVFTPEDYGLPGAAQAVDVSSGENPGICFKTSTPLKVEFDYIKLENFNGESFSIKKITEGDFKSSFEQKPESELPYGIKTFLEENAYGFAGLTLMENNTKNENNCLLVKKEDNFFVVLNNTYLEFFSLSFKSIPVLTYLSTARAAFRGIAKQPGPATQPPSQHMTSIILLSHPLRA